MSHDLDSNPEFQLVRMDLALVPDHERDGIAEMLRRAGYECVNGMWSRSRRQDQDPVSGQIGS